ncbi:SCO family protein [Aureisphaera galaxeae]|uniref:SCO family protein n=1 Tax=Aureisphaera galaxeae TaxID=1538023 RepID=UPI002350F56F|nr:SCO family protein [Aureisphaera galaxeae]MDC8002512.1 SCO family protein [Aureisphaera galaxeae]
MLQFFAKYKPFVIVLGILSVFIIYGMYTALKPVPKLKVYQPADFDPELVDTTLQHVKKYHTISDFALTNQNGETVTQKTYENKIYVADFFFTTCQTICPIMTDHMLEIQKELKEEKDILLLSHTVTPEIDTIAQLKRYATEKGVDDLKWNLVTGDKKQIYDLARKSYLVVKDIPGVESYGMIHTENFVLVDPQRRIRGLYDGTDPEEIQRLLEDIEILKNEK